MSDQDNFYTVQKILARKRTKQGSFCYKIKWKNWPISTSTWQPAEHLQYVRDMVNKYDRFCDMRRGKKRISRQRKSIERSDEDESQQKLKKKEGIVGGKKTTNESQINQNQQDNEKNINNGKKKSSVFLIVKNCRNKENILQNQITKNSNTIVDQVLTKQYLKRTIKRINKGKIGRINHMKAVNQMRRQRKRRQLQKRQLQKEQRINDDINIDTRIKKKGKRIKKAKNIQNILNLNDQNENQVKVKRKYIRRLKINIDKRSSRRIKPIIEIPNEEKKMEQEQNQQNKTPQRREKKYNRRGRPKKILSKEQLQLRKEKIRVSRKYSRPGRPNVVLSQEQKEKRREMRRLKLRKYDRRGRPKKIQTQQQIQRKKQVLKQRRRIKRRQKERIAREAEKFQNPIIIPKIKRTQFSNKKENYSDVIKKQEVNEADIIKMKEIEQWNSGQNIGFTESNQEQKLKAINEQSHILLQQSPYRMPIYTPLQAFNIKQGNLDLGQQSYPKLQQTKRSYRRRKINIDKFKRRQNPKRRKQRSFANLFSYERSKDLIQIPKQVYQSGSIQKVEFKSKEAAVPKEQDSLFQIVQNQTLRDQLFNYKPEKNFSNKTIYQDNKILVQFRNEQDQKCAIEVGELTKYCGDWLKCFYQSYI